MFTEEKLFVIFTAKPTNSLKLGRLLMLGSCAANGFRICVYLRPSTVPYFRNSSLVLK